MSKTPIYDSEHLAQGAADPQDPLNDALDRIEVALNATKQWTITGDVNPTKLQMAEGYYHELIGSPASPFAFGIPATARRFCVINNSGQICTVFVQGLSGTGVAVSNGSTVELRSDGANIEEVGSTGGLTLVEEGSLAGLSTKSVDIPQTARNILITVYARSTAGGSPNANVALQFNGDTGNNYDLHGPQIQNATNGNMNAAATSNVGMAVIPWSGASANMYGHGEAKVFNYRSAAYKRGHLVRGTMGNTSVDTTWITANAGFQWRNVAAITSIALTISAGNFDTESYYSVHVY